MAEPLRPTPRRSPIEHAVALVRWIGVGRIAGVAAAVLAVGAGSFWLLRSPADGSPGAAPAPPSSAPPTGGTGAASADDPAGAPLPGDAPTGASVPGEGAAGTPGGATSTPTSTAPASVVVHVAGAVAQPGVYRVAAGSRAGDAVAAAGGPAPDAATDAVNLAAPLADGQQVYVPRVGEAAGPAAPAGAGSGPGAAGSAEAAPLNLNTADEAALLDLPGVGPVIAAAILRYRAESGPFTSVEQLLEVSGIGPARLASLDGLVTV